MATAEEIATLRLLIAEEVDELPYSDQVLGERLDASNSAAGLAREIWTEKAARYAELVNVSESGSSRNLSDLHKNALAMAGYFEASDPNAPGTGVAVRGVRMQRLTR